MKTKKRVLVGMSGGVDSSVTAALLLEQGYDVIGITMQLLSKEDEKKSACCNLGAVNDAKRVATKLGIPHYTINSRDAFKTNVIDHFVTTYANGQTPNPCVECNRYIKFDELWKKATELDADFMATGHYCQNIYNPETHTYDLKKAVDTHKDQSYFLYMLTQEKLQKILFPLGGYEKSEVRKLAEKYKLINANKPDSQDICFVANQSYKQYVFKRLPEEKRQPGHIKNRDGNILGSHTGLYQFTIGQRKGLNISAPNPLYVIDINPESNEVIVGEKDDLPKNTLALHTFTQVNNKEVLNNTTVELKVRYKMDTINGTIQKAENGGATVTIPESGSIAPGQSCVLYDNNRLIGGGIIDSKNPTLTHS